MTNFSSRWTGILAVCLASCLSFGAADGRIKAFAKAPPYTASVVRWKDADTLVVKHCLGNSCREENIRLHWADAPEVAHNRKEIDQPGGREALDYVTTHYRKGVILTISVVGKSYDRLVADVTTKDGKDLAIELVQLGFSMCDPKYKPSQQLINSQRFAAEHGLGIWKDKNVIEPWTWRAMTRTEQKRHK